MTAAEFRRIALSLPEASQAAHMGHPSRPSRAAGVAAVLRTSGCGPPRRARFAKPWSRPGGTAPRSDSPSSWTTP